MRETVREKLKDGRTKIIHYSSPRSFLDVVYGAGKIESITYLNSKGEIEERHKYNEDGVATTTYFDYDENGRVKDKHVFARGVIIRDRRNLTKFLNSVSSKSWKEHVVSEYRELFPKTEQEKAERNAERVTRQKKLKELKAQGR